MKNVKDKTIISLFMYSISTTAIVYQNYIFISNLLKNYRAFEWLCIKNEDDNIINDDFFVCNEQENYVQYLLILGFIIQFLSGSIGSVLIKIFSKKIIAQTAFVFLFFGWIILGTALSYSKYYVDNNIKNKIPLVSFFLNLSFIFFGIGSDNSYLPIIYYINDRYPVEDINKNLYTIENNNNNNKLQKLKYILKNKNYILISTMSSLAVLSLFVGNVINITLKYLHFQNNVIIVILTYLALCVIPAFFIANFLDYNPNMNKNDNQLVSEDNIQTEEDKNKINYINSVNHINNINDGINSNNINDGINSNNINDAIISNNSYNSINVQHMKQNTHNNFNHTEHVNEKTLLKNDLNNSGEKNVQAASQNVVVVNMGKDEIYEQNEKRRVKLFNLNDVDFGLLKNQIKSSLYIFIVVEFFLITFSVCYFMFSLFDIYENNVFGDTLNIYSLILPSSFIFTLIFGIIADVINISNFISFNLILGIFVYILIYFYYTTTNVTIGYISLVLYFFHQSFFANHMYMYMSTIFKQDNFSILIGIINTFASLAFFMSYKIHEFIKMKNKNSVYPKAIAQGLFISYVVIFFTHIFYIKRKMRYHIISGTFSK
ncbi:transporter, putative [Plasmodium sp. gorilla clade G2]|uniref:transporter, putative n=1 Tax=Plasmodium sp. gorilla clade G2 TaxID=880535 RepID=UPI000D20472F|nr:transporter, putative [Plasmodium sp. gorilla clade G2]SOV10860.1 transporter, putative [Plasmodium sp. gorilla clade G2]